MKHVPENRAAEAAVVAAAAVVVTAAVAAAAAVTAVAVAEDEIAKQPARHAVAKFAARSSQI